jgi:ATP-dependent Clp protease adaptor protein ClpS
MNILKTEQPATMSENDRSAKVLLLNDDQTPMEFVVLVLESIFGKTRDEALKLMLAIDCDGSGECGVYTPELASKIAERVAELARGNGYLLRCIVEASPNA